MSTGSWVSDPQALSKLCHLNTPGPEGAQDPKLHPPEAETQRLAPPPPPSLPTREALFPAHPPPHPVKRQLSQEAQGLGQTAWSLEETSAHPQGTEGAAPIKGRHLAGGGHGQGARRRGGAGRAAWAGGV